MDDGYEFQGGYPTAETIQRAYDDADLSRAVEAYKFFLPTVTAAAGFASLDSIGVKTNHTAAIIQGNPRQLIYTPNSDTPYALVPLDLSGGPFVVRVPPGPIICLVNDLNQRYVMDLGLPGPDAGKGGAHLVAPPEFVGNFPEGYHTGMATTNRVVLLVRAIPKGGNDKGAIQLMRSLRVHPLDTDAVWNGLEWIDISDRDWDSTAASIETNIGYWEVLHRLIDSEPPFGPYWQQYGELATLGIVKGRPFEPDDRMRSILTRASAVANGQLRVQAFADRRPDRIVWPDRAWEWAALHFSNGTFEASTYTDLEAREKWFFQALFESPAMFRREPGSGSLYWLATRDRAGTWLDGGASYRLSVPLPVPAKLFWSVTVYDTETRSEIQTDQAKAALRSLIDLRGVEDACVELFFGPDSPPREESRWIKTAPGRGWFAYFRIYGPGPGAFDGSWKPGDFESLSEGTDRT